MTSAQAKTPVIFDHDGGIDDILSLLLTLTMPQVELKGVCITPADCYPDDALTSSLKLLTLAGQTEVPVAVGNLVGPNPFPPEWRAQPRVCHAMPQMLRIEECRDNVQPVAAHEWLVDYLSQCTQKVTVVMTGPASNLAWVLKRHPQLANKIEQVIWMGGAVEVKGNVAMHDHDGSAEWNAYWDPQATYDLVHSDVNLLMVPLDATNALPVDRAFLQNLAKADTALSDLAGQLWAATTTAIPAYEFTYFLWDILATSILGVPANCYSVKERLLSVQTTTPSAGQTFINDEGSLVRWVSEVDAQLVVEYVTEQFSGTLEKLKLAKC